MTSQVFYRKWRPQTLAQVVGQEHVTRTLANALKTGRVAHAYLFCGPRGTGKTSTGRILAKAVNCLEGGAGEPCNACSLCKAISEGHAMDVVEIDAASNRGIDEIRDLRERVKFAPNIARYKVYIIDEVHMLTEPAANALLKTLEEPPPHVKFVLATTEPHKVPATILSRCQRFDFRRIPQDAMVSRLTDICEREDITIEPAALKLIARRATGSMRDAENLLEQLVAYYSAKIELHQVQAVLGITGDPRAQELAKHIVNRDISAGLATINSVVLDGLDLRQFNRELVELLRGLLLIKAGAAEAVDLTPEAMAEMKALAARTSLDQLSQAVKLFRQVEVDFDGFSPLPLELAFVECALPKEEEVPSPAPPTKEEPVIAPAPAEPRETEAPVAPEAGKVEPVEKPSPEIEHLRTRWRDVVDAVKGMGSKGNLDAYLRSACEPVALEGDTLILGFYYAFHKERIEDPKYRHMVEEKVSEVFGAPYKIRCRLIGPKSKGHLIEAALQMGAKIVDREEE
ncbi:Holliday junction ATP-dependent DNA helicase RuvB [subsurface metagenome]